MEIFGKVVLILPDKLPEKTKGGLIIPRTAKDLPKTGIVVGVGHVCTEVKPDDHITYPRKAASIMMIKGVEHHFIFENKILYIE